MIKMRKMRIFLPKNFAVCEKCSIFAVGFTNVKFGDKITKKK